MVSRKKPAPLAIVAIHPRPNYNSTTRISFRVCAQVNKYHEPRNTNQPRTTGAPLSDREPIRLIFLMSLSTGEIIQNRTWTELPMGIDPIESVEARALKERQPLLCGKGPFFEWRTGIPIDNKHSGDYDDDYSICQDEYFLQAETKIDEDMNLDPNYYDDKDEDIIDDDMIDEESVGNEEIESPTSMLNDVQHNKDV